jgi:hypothetical protein
VQLPGNALGHQPAVAIEHVDLRVVDGRADRYEVSLTVEARRIVVADVVQLGAAVVVEQARTGNTSRKASTKAFGKGSPAVTQIFNAGSRCPLERSCSMTCSRCDGPMLRRLTSCFASAATKGCRISNGVVVDEHLGAAVEQPCEQLLDRDRKDERRLLGDDLTRLERQPVSSALSQLSSWRWGTRTPLGLPVDPDVYMT